MGLLWRILAISLTAALAVVSTSCSGGTGSSDQALRFSELNPQMIQLPEVADLDSARDASVATEFDIHPQQSMFSGGNASPQGDDLLLDSSAGTSSWAMYGFQAGEDPLISMRLTFSYPNGPGAWVAIANYVTERWDWQPKAQLTQQIYQLNTTQARDYVSPQGNMFFVVLSAGGADVVVTDIKVTADLPPPPTFSISGRVADANQQGLSGILIGLTPGGDQTTTDGSGNYSFAGLEDGNYVVTPQDADFNFTPESRNVTVSGKDSPDNDFVAEPAQTTVTFVADILPITNGTMGTQFSCLPCHTGQFPQSGLDMLDYNDVVARASKINDRINREQGSPGFMPNGKTKWTPEMLQKFQDWIDGGMIEQ